MTLQSCLHDVIQTILDQPIAERSQLFSVVDQLLNTLNNKKDLTPQVAFDFFNISNHSVKDAVKKLIEAVNSFTGTLKELAQVFLSSRQAGKRFPILFASLQAKYDVAMTPVLDDAKDSKDNSQDSILVNPTVSTGFSSSSSSYGSSSSSSQIEILSSHTSSTAEVVQLDEKSKRSSEYPFYDVNQYNKISVKARNPNSTALNFLKKYIADVLTVCKAGSDVAVIIQQNLSGFQVQLKNPNSYRLPYSFLHALKRFSNGPFPLLNSISSVNLEIDLDLVTKAMTNGEYDNVRFLYQWLVSQGFNVDSGRRGCAQYYGLDWGILNRPNDLAKRDHVDKSFALQLHAESKEAGYVSFGPLALRIVTRDDKLMRTLEEYYAYAQLKNVSGTKDKTFIPETRQSGMLHESNISAYQAGQILPCIERALTATSDSGELAVALNESSINAEIMKYRAQMFKEVSQALEFKDNKQNESDSLTEVQFHKQLETLVNNKLVFGPEAIRMLLRDSFPQESKAIAGPDEKIHPYSAKLLTMQQTTSESKSERSNNNSRSLVRSLQSSSNSYQPLVPWARKEDTKHVLAILLATAPQATLNSLTAAEKSMINSTEVGNDDLWKIRNFFKENSPWAFVKTIIERFEEQINKAAGENQQEKMVNILKVIGVEPNDRDKYKIQTMGGRLNGFQITLDLPVLLIVRFVKENLLFNANQIDSSHHCYQWMYDCGNKRYAKEPQSWMVGMEFRVNERFNCCWGTTKQPYNLSYQQSDVKEQRSGLTGNYNPNRFLGRGYGSSSSSSTNSSTSSSSNSSSNRSSGFSYNKG